jgi:hypothetical protein
VSRLYGIVLLVALVALAVSLRQRAETRSERILANERIVAARVEQLADALRLAISEDDPPAVRLGSLARQRGLTALPDTGDDRTAFAEDELYTYGLGTTIIVDKATGRRVDGWVLRAWPRVFGVTGDIEFHVDNRGVVWHGQNEVGRSGVTEGFPPKFPAKEIGQPKQAIWWRPIP